MLTGLEPGTLEWHAARSLVQYAAGLAIFCPECDTILDRSRTVVASDGDRATVTRCAACWGRMPMLVRSGSVEVLDGRLLFPAPVRSSKRRK